LNGTLGAGAAAVIGGANTAIRRIRRLSKSLENLLCKFAGAKLQAEKIDKQNNPIPIGLNIIVVESSRSTTAAQQKLVPPRQSAE
jgi:hypothetical protein